MRLNARVTLIALITLAVGVLACWRFVSLRSGTPSAHAARAQLAKDLRAQAQPVFARLRMATPATPEGASELRQFITTVHPTGKPPSPADADRLREEVIDFIEARFANTDPDVYMQWRARKGYPSIPLDTLRGTFAIHTYWQHLLGSPMPLDISFEDAFRTLWHAQHSSPRGRIARIAADSDGLGIHFGVLPPDSSAIDWPGGAIPRDLWIGATGATSSSWFGDPNPFRAYRQAPSANLPYAISAFIVEFDDSRRQPIMATWVLDRRTGLWRLTHVNQYNFDPALALAIVY